MESLSRKTLQSYLPEKILHTALRHAPCFFWSAAAVNPSDWQFPANDAIGAAIPAIHPPASLSL